MHFKENKFPYNEFSQKIASQNSVFKIVDDINRPCTTIKYLDGLLPLTFFTFVMLMKKVQFT